VLCPADSETPIPKKKTLSIDVFTCLLLVRCPATRAAMIKLSLLALLPLAAAHSSLIKPKPRNAIDSELPEWKDGNAPYYWQPISGSQPHALANTPCACRNGTDVCASAQTCLWFSVGCTIGCKECDGGDKGNPTPTRSTVVALA
jgi:hypothetical protein